MNKNKIIPKLFIAISDVFFSLNKEKKNEIKKYIIQNQNIKITKMEILFQYRHKSLFSLKYDMYNN